MGTLTWACANDALHKHNASANGLEKDNIAAPMKTETHCQNKSGLPD
jgi:hypothetical protein